MFLTNIQITYNYQKLYTLISINVILMRQINITRDMLLTEYLTDKMGHQCQRHIFYPQIEFKADFHM